MRYDGSKTLLSAVVVCLMAVAAVGCGVRGTPTPGEIDIRTLDVGNYPTEPLDYRTEYSHDSLFVSRLGMARLAGAVANGIDIDPDLRHTVQLTGLPDDTGSTAWVLSDAAAPVLDRYHLLFGVSVTTSTQPLEDRVDPYLDASSIRPYLYGTAPSADATSVNIVVLQFPDEAAARDAATDIEAADFGAADANQPVTLDSYPQAKAHWQPGIPSLGTTVARGDYVVNIFVQVPQPDLPTLIARTRRVLDLQLPMLDQLPPLSDRQLLELDYDPDGILRRTLHPDDSELPRFPEESTVTTHGFLNVTEDVPTWKDLLGRAGVDRVGQVDKTLLFRARDAAAASALSAGIAAVVIHRTDAPPGVPDAFCYTQPLSEEGTDYEKVLCAVHYGRYVGIVESEQLEDAHQQAAAQYALLAVSAYE
ncbi:DUF7373 family lipoprotein [Nocardia sp. CDC160]|uniref:DUF7373 family lipoprotein n=1 Tax=Nocardia sp. CDC160 TaxID=3112166 RepID=UPI002DB9E10A|nr:hypothetical protein [Nocardia sp. CDC160]MEC3913267.1 hypothetical protein [Nocardia sp. CDC160]